MGYFPDDIKTEIEHNGKKLDVIAEALAHSGIVIWQGIPERIVKELKEHGYEIRRTKTRT